MKPPVRSTRLWNAWPIQQEKDADIVSKVRGAMIYPLIVLLVMVGVVGFMIVKVLPQVKNIYAGLQGADCRC